MHILSTALFDRPALSCLSHGVVLGSDGQKMRSRCALPGRVRGVRPRRRGRDALVPDVSSILRGGNRPSPRRAPRRRPAGADPAVERVVLLRALHQRGRTGARWAADSPTSLTGTCSPGCGSSSATSGEADRYDIAWACDAVAGYVEILPNWNIRRSADRFWAGSAESTLSTRRSRCSAGPSRRCSRWSARRCGAADR